MKGKIYCGYPGVGKSSVSGIGSGIIDLESSNFFVNGKRDPEWYKMYVNIVWDLIEQGFSVFCPTHKELRDELRARGLKYVLIYPSIQSKSEWLERLRNRPKTDKNTRAYESVNAFYERNIMDLASDPGCSDKIVIDSTDYDLLDKI